MIQGFPTPSKYKVLVRCNTFNQAKYIEDTLKGFAMQQTNFPYLVYVIDDASTDGEQDILRKWIDNHCHPYEVKTYDNDLAVILMAKDKDNENCIYAFHLLKKNLYMKPEKQEIHNFWRSQVEYEALCEGDDYWIEPLKLQKQYNYLESHANCSLCAHRASTFYVKEQKTLPYKFSGIVGDKGLNVSMKDLVHYEFALFPTASMIYRTSIFIKYHDIIRTVHMFDYMLKLVLKIEGEIFILPDVMSVYRKGSAESWTNKTNDSAMIRHLEASIKDINTIRDVYDGRYTEELTELIHNRQFSIMEIKADLKGLRSEQFNTKFKSLSTKRKLLIYFRHYFPTLNEIILPKLKYYKRCLLTSL